MLCTRCSATMVLTGRSGASLHRDKLRLDYLGGVLVKSTFRNDMWLALVIAICFPERVSRRGESGKYNTAPNTALLGSVCFLLRS